MIVVQSSNMQLQKCGWMKEYCCEYRREEIYRCRVKLIGYTFSRMNMIHAYENIYVHKYIYIATCEHASAGYGGHDGGGEQENEGKLGRGDA